MRERQLSAAGTSVAMAVGGKGAVEEGTQADQPLNSVHRLSELNASRRWGHEVVHDCYVYR